MKEDPSTESFLIEGLFGKNRAGILRKILPDVPSRPERKFRVCERALPRSKG
jgi:hypothetical protein